ncbi:flagellar biosynthesis anti-sigma factor FlgM [Candidatus Poribacteria bacterium]
MKKRKGRQTSLTRDTEVQRLAELARGIPDVRKARVEAVKKQIKSGTYDVSAESVARSIVDLHRRLKSDE